MMKTEASGGSFGACGNAPTPFSQEPKQLFPFSRSLCRQLIQGPNMLHLAIYRMEAELFSKGQQCLGFATQMDHLCPKRTVLHGRWRYYGSRFLSQTRDKRVPALFISTPLSVGQCVWGTVRVPFKSSQRQFPALGLLMCEDQRCCLFIPSFLSSHAQAFSSFHWRYTRCFPQLFLTLVFPYLIFMPFSYSTCQLKASIRFFQPVYWQFFLQTFFDIRGGLWEKENQFRYLNQI